MQQFGGGYQGPLSAAEWLVVDAQQGSAQVPQAVASVVGVPDQGIKFVPSAGDEDAVGFDVVEAQSLEGASCSLAEGREIQVTREPETATGERA